MWSSARALLVVLLALTLGACGFRPMYAGGTNTGVNADLAAVEVRLPSVQETNTDDKLVEVNSRLAQEIRNSLEQRISAAGRAKPAYVLSIRVETRSQDLGIRRDSTASRANIRTQADWTLSREGETLRQGRTVVYSAYNILSRQYATVVSEKTARSRSAEQVADEIIRQVSVYFTRND